MYTEFLCLSCISFSFDQRRKAMLADLHQCQTPASQPSQLLLLQSEMSIYIFHNCEDRISRGVLWLKDWQQKKEPCQCRGTVAAMHAVMQGSRRMVAANIAGGTHHAFAGHGEGFCKKYLVAFLLLSLKLLPNFFIHVDVTTEMYMLISSLRMWEESRTHHLESANISLRTANILGL